MEDVDAMYAESTGCGVRRSCRCRFRSSPYVRRKILRLGLMRYFCMLTVGIYDLRSLGPGAFLLSRNHLFTPRGGSRRPLLGFG